MITLAAIVLIAVVAVAVFIALPKGGNAVPLPDYLSHCVYQSTVYHAHPTLNIVINGTSVTIPAGVGIRGTCNEPIHTHDTKNVLHVETDVNRDYTVGDFLLIWGNWVNNAQQAIFNSTQIFGNHAVAGHTLTFTVNGTPDPSFQNYVVPHNAQSQGETCQTAPCQDITMTITYS